MVSQGQMAPGALTCTKEAWFSCSMKTQCLGPPGGQAPPCAHPDRQG